MICTEAYIAYVKNHIIVICIKVQNIAQVKTYVHKEPLYHDMY